MKRIEKLEQRDYRKVLPLLKSRNELSVVAVIEGRLPGEVFVNCGEEPSAVLVRTSECNLVAGDVNDQEFNEFVGEVVGFWDAITPDSKEWCEVIPEIHQDKFIREYRRHHYLLESGDWVFENQGIPEGYVLEYVIPQKLRECEYENAEQIVEWMENWGDDETFLKNGAGTYLRNENTIVSWSLSDCACSESVAIGIETDQNYRKRGFAKIVAAETIRQCFQKGYRKVEWLCVEYNKGSRALATSLGFHLNNTYVCYAPYAPVENLADLSESQWGKWAEYFEQAAKEEPRLLEECIYTYVKANNPEKVEELLLRCEDKELLEEEIYGFTSYLHSMGMASRF